jgi:hypothetical protein
MTETELVREMRRMGEPESSVRYWATREALWNGERVVVEAPRPWPVNQEDEE